MYTSNKLAVCGFVGSRITRTHDFGFVALDMTHVRGEDEGVYICRASNALGEAVTTASMKIRSKLVNCICNVTTLSTHCYTFYKQRNCMGEKCL
jgi:Immunoglobulin I-set domain.